MKGWEVQREGGGFEDMRRGGMVNEGVLMGMSLGHQDCQQGSSVERKQL